MHRNRGRTARRLYGYRKRNEREGEGPPPPAKRGPVRIAPDVVYKRVKNALEVYMATRGPTPKRDAERRRTNKRPPTTAAARGGNHPQPRALKGWHPSMTRWYKSLAESGQAQFYEPSDWEAARLIADFGTELINDGLKASGFAALWSAMGDMLTTEGSRRRMSVELKQDTPAKPEPPGVAVLNDYRESLGRPPGIGS